MKLRGWLTPAALAIVVALAGCSRVDPRVYVPAREEESGAVAVAGGPTSLEIAADPGGALAFTTSTLQATAGQPLSVAFSNPGNQPHNWVLVEPGQEQAVAAAALPNQGNVPEGTDGVIVAGAVLDPGGSETITVESPLSAGEYSYICTFPGHYPSMQGELIAGEATAAGDTGDTAASGDTATGEEATNSEGTSGTFAVSADPSGALEYTETELTAPANQPLEVEFTNEGNQPHNWVLVEQGQERAVAAAALPNLGNVPEGTEGVIAAGAVLQPGESETITVESPVSAGTYSYICTFPGHYPSMQGTLTAQ